MAGHPTNGRCVTNPTDGYVETRTMWHSYDRYPPHVGNNARRDGEKHACGGVQARTRQRSDELADLAPVAGASDCQLWRGCQRKRACRGAAVVELAVIGGGLLYSRIDEP